MFVRSRLGTGLDGKIEASDVVQDAFLRVHVLFGERWHALEEPTVKLEEVKVGAG